MPHRALTDVLLGHQPPVQAGEVIPGSFRDAEGTEHPVDFDRLVELGAAEKVSATEARKAAKDTDTADATE